MDKHAVDEIFRSIKSTYNYQYDLNTKQLKVISSILSGRNTFCVLPTGFGKSDCFILPPLILEEMTGEKHIVVVISPLRSLMKDMCLKLRAKNIQSACIVRAKEVDEETCKGLVNGNFTIVFASPEVMQDERWRKMLRSTVYRERLCLFVCDEAHCISEWGESFRPSYKEVAAIKSLVDAPLLLATATATSEMKNDLQLLFEIDELNTIAEVPDRPNIFLTFKSHSGMTIEEELKWVRDVLLLQLEGCPKMIIYCQSIRTAADIYEYLVDALLSVGKKSLIQFYHSEVHKETQEMITEDFPKIESGIRILVSTIAFGMGVNIPDVRKVIHWGSSKSVLSYWQEIGRCGRDGAPSEAFLYATKTSLDKRKVSETMLDICKALSSNKDCMRRKLLQQLTIPEMQDCELQYLDNRRQCDRKCGECKCAFCTCCCFCRGQCPCTILASPEGLEVQNKDLWEFVQPCEQYQSFSSSTGGSLIQLVWNQRPFGQNLLLHSTMSSALTEFKNS